MEITIGMQFRVTKTGDWHKVISINGHIATIQDSGGSFFPCYTTFVAICASMYGVKRAWMVGYV